jgi:hypothetical protein
MQHPTQTQRPVSQTLASTSAAIPEEESNYEYLIKRNWLLVFGWVFLCTAFVVTVYYRAKYGK